MDPNNETQEGTVELSEETAKLAALGRGEAAAATETAEAGTETVETGSKPERPADVPEKFWDAEKGAVNIENLLKSYTELEKARGKKPEEAEEGKDEKPGEEEKSEEGEATGISPELFTTAQTEYADKGALSDKTRKSIIASGVPEATLDTYLAGVAALSASLTTQVYETAGGEEVYKAALKWAGGKWSQSQISKFDSGIDDADLREPLIKGLMADYHAANPGEGQQTRPGGGGGDGDLYTDHAEFQKDLAAADKANDQVARKKAVEKLARSRQAKTLKTTQSRRTGMSQFS